MMPKSTSKNTGFRQNLLKLSNKFNTSLSPFRIFRGAPKTDLTVLNSPYLRYHHDEAEPDLLWMVFSCVNVPDGKFSQSNVFAKAPGCKLFINCKDNSWYQQGISPEINSIERLVDALLELAAKTPRVRVSGHSMGAYLALIMQHLGDIEYAIATSPEPILMIPEGRSGQNNVRPQEGWENLLERFSGSTCPAPGYAFFGAYDPVDAYFLAKIEGHAELYRQVYTCPFHHGITEYLNNKRSYLPMLLDPFNETKKLYNQKVLQHHSDYGSKHEFLDFYELHRLLCSNADHADIEKLVFKRAGWNNPGWQCLRAKGLARAGRRQEAAKIARNAIDPESLFAAPAYLYAKILKRTGEHKALNRFSEELAEHRIDRNDKKRIFEIIEA